MSFKAPPDSPDARSLPSGKALFDEVAPFAWRTLRYLGVPESDLPDITQEVLLSVHRNVHTFAGRSALKTWVYRICHRTAFAFFRKSRRYRPLKLQDVPQLNDRDDPRERLDARLLLNALLDKLDVDKRTVIVLYEIEGLEMKEVAEVVGCPLQTAYSRLHAARRLLEKELSMGRDGSAA